MAVQRDVIRLMSGHSDRTVRIHCEPIGYDRDGRALYDYSACMAKLSTVATRQRKRTAA
jgi:hypothetical protein